MSKLLAKYKDGDKEMIYEVIEVAPGENGAVRVILPLEENQVLDKNEINDCWIARELVEIYEDKGGEG